MSVYVDDMEAPFGRMKMSHMLADTTDELNAMADKIGIDRKWIQQAGTCHEHYDISLSKRRLAIEYGALFLTRDQLGDLLLKRRASVTPSAEATEKVTK